MFNLFNLFLFLLASWLFFMISANKITWLYLIFGVISSMLVTQASYKMKLLNQKSELLYLSIGFYRHFFQIYFAGFCSSLILVVKMALSKNFVNPIVFNLKFEESKTYNSGLLISSINMSSGLFVIGTKENEIFVHAISDYYFSKLNIRKIHNSLCNVNDDNLV